MILVTLKINEVLQTDIYLDEYNYLGLRSFLFCVQSLFELDDVCQIIQTINKRRINRLAILYVRISFAHEKHVRYIYSTAEIFNDFTHDFKHI